MSENDVIQVYANSAEQTLFTCTIIINQLIAKDIMVQIEVKSEF